MEDRILYCFKFDEKTGDIDVDEIKEFRVVNLSKYVPRYVIRFIKNGTGCSIRESNLNKLVNWRVYSFDPSLENAKYVIKRDIKKRIDKAYSDYSKWSKINKLI